VGGGRDTSVLESNGIIVAAAAGERAAARCPPLTFLSLLKNENNNNFRGGIMALLFSNVITADQAVQQHGGYPF
jgi:hypothetical protein